MNRNIRKMIVIAGVVGAALSLSVGIAAAKYGPPTRPIPTDPAPAAAEFIDLDGDGVCDNLDGDVAGYGDGTGLEPQDGTGLGAASLSSGASAARTTRAASGSGVTTWTRTQARRR
jgi:hypothetical protein